MAVTPDTCMALLRDLGITFDRHDHEAVFTTAQSAHLYERIKGQHCKNLFVRDKKGRMALVVVRDDVHVDLTGLATMLGFERLSFGSPDRLMTYLGVTPGSVCPFALINDTTHAVQLVLDRAMMAADFVSYHPLINTMTLTLTPSDLLRFFEYTGHVPMIIDLPTVS